MITSPRPLAAEQEALSRILSRVMDDAISLDDQCKYAPRIVSVAANLARIQQALEVSAKTDSANDIVLQALQDLQEENANEENAW